MFLFFKTTSRKKVQFIRTGHVSKSYSKASNEQHITRVPANCLLLYLPLASCSISHAARGPDWERSDQMCVMTSCTEA